MEQFTVYLRSENRIKIRDLARQYDLKQSAVVDAVLTVFFEELNSDETIAPRLLAESARLSLQ